VAEPLLFVDHASAIGGAERSLLLLLEHLDPARWEPHLVCPEGPLAVEARKGTSRIHPISLPRLRRSLRFGLDGARGSLALARVARRTGAALIHANTVRAAFYTAAAARLAGVPFIWHMRDFWLGEQAPARPQLDRLGKRLLAASAARVVANSYAVARTLPPMPHLTVVQNGIEVTAFDPSLSGEPFRHCHDIPASASIIGMVGRLRPWKGQDRFLRIAARVSAAVPTAHYVIVGGNPFADGDDYAPSLPRLAAQLGIGDRVTFTGHLGDVRPALAAFDVFVHPGHPEPFGLVNVEAMAMALPVVAFAHGALPEIVNPDTGFLIPPWAEEAMAGAIISLLDEPMRREELGAAARARVERHFTIQRVAAEMDAVFAAVLG
jgi:glycosyltransferase involved in cell wall biosynthesis